MHLTRGKRIGKQGRLYETERGNAKGVWEDLSQSMFRDCEILENDDYIACMIRTAQCLKEENDREYRWQAFETVSELPQSYRTPFGTIVSGSTK